MISVAMAASLGAGVLFSCVSVFVYQAAPDSRGGVDAAFMSRRRLLK